MAGQAVDKKFANIGIYAGPSAGFGAGFKEGRIAVGDSWLDPEMKRYEAGFSVDVGRGARRVVYLGPQDLQRQSQVDVFYQLRDRNIAGYPIKNGNQYYPNRFEKDQNLAVKSDSTVLLSAGPSVGDNVILAARPSEMQWVYAWNGKNLAKVDDVTYIKWGLDQGAKLTLTGGGRDIAIGGHGKDYVGPGLPLQSWVSLATTNGQDLEAAVNVDLSRSTEFRLLQSGTGESVMGNDYFRITKTSLPQNNGRKAYIGGSDGDVLWGGDEDDLLVGDRFDSYETYFSPDQASRERLYAAVGLKASDPIIQNNQRQFTPESYNAKNLRSPQYVWWYEERPDAWWRYYVYNNGPIDHLYSTTRPGTIRLGSGYSSWWSSPQYDGTHTIHDPVWKPGGDRIFGGAGGDTIHGDNNVNNVARLALIKNAFNVSNSKGNYVGRRTSFEQDFGRLANDFIDGGLGDDVVTGGVGKDHLIGGAGRDVIYLPDVITAPGYKNVTGPAGEVSWIMGDGPGLEREPDLFVLGLNYTTEEAMIASSVADGGANSSPAELEKLIGDFNKESKNFLLAIASLAVKPIPAVGSILSAMLKYSDKKMKEYAKSQGKPPADLKPNDSDSAAVIVDFGREDLFMIPVAKGETVDAVRIADNSGLNYSASADTRFVKKTSNSVEIDITVNANDYKRLILQDFDNMVDGKPVYEFFRFQGTGDYDFWFYGHRDYKPLMAQFDPSQGGGVLPFA